MSDVFILAVKTNSTVNDIALIEQMMRDNIDPDYTTTNSVVWTKKGPPNADYYVANYDVEGRGFPFRADNATAWINSHSGDFDQPQNIIVLKKWGQNWSPKEPEE